MGRGVIGYAGLLGLVALVAACAADGASTGTLDEPQSAPPIPTAEPRRDRHREPTTSSAPLPDEPSFVCRAGAFCDDFEDVAPGSQWRAVGVGIDFVSPSWSPGRRALRVRVDGGGSPAFLRFVPAEATAATTWSGVVALALRLEKEPRRGIVGPEIATREASGASLSLAIRGGTLFVEQRPSGCASTACAERVDAVGVVHPAAWSRVTVGVEANEAGAATFGRVEVSVDDGYVSLVPLAVHLGGDVEVRAGITGGDEEPAELRVDDVMFFAL